jgi:hypothetical protein
VTINVRPDGLSVDRQRERKDAPVTLFALGPYCPAVGFYDHFTDHQTETGAFVVRTIGIPPLAIFLEKLADLLAGNAIAAILNPNSNTACGSQSCSDLYFAAIAGKFNGVTDQIA